MLGVLDSDRGKVAPDLASTPPELLGFILSESAGFRGRRPAQAELVPDTIEQSGRAHQVFRCLTCPSPVSEYSFPVSESR